MRVALEHGALVAAHGPVRFLRAGEDYYGARVLVVGFARMLVVWACLADRGRDEIVHAALTGVGTGVPVLQFSVLLLLDKNPGRNQTEIANTLGILRPNFVAMLDALESRDLCARMRSTNDRRSHILVLTDKGRAVLARAKKLVANKHEARLIEVLGPANHAALLEMLAKLAQEF